MIKHCTYLLGIFACCSLQSSSTPPTHSTFTPDDVANQAGRQAFKWVQKCSDVQSWINEGEHQGVDQDLTEQRRLWQGFWSKIMLVFMDLMEEFSSQPPHDPRLSILQAFQEIEDYHWYIGTLRGWSPPAGTTELHKRIQAYEARRLHPEEQK